MFGFIPKDEQFFVLFQQMTYNIIDASKELKKMLDSFEDPKASQKIIKELEHRGDSITHEILKRLNKTFITPLDREDIHSLASKLDDVLDLIDACAQRIVMYNIKEITPEAKALGFIILQSCNLLDKAVALLNKSSNDELFKLCVEINTMENEADRVSREAIRRLFDEEKNPIEVIKWKEIYETLETATDKCEDAANILESVVVKNA